MILAFNIFGSKLISQRCTIHHRSDVVQQCFTGLTTCLHYHLHAEIKHDHQDDQYLGQ